MVSSWIPLPNVRICRAMVDELTQEVIRFAKQRGVLVCVPVEISMLRPQEKIRAFCRQNKCGQYQQHYMCPPHIGSLALIREQLKAYDQGVLVQHWWALDVKNDRETLDRTKIDFHQMVLDLEQYLEQLGQHDPWGLIGGNCALCKVCHLTLDEPCANQDRARTSLEAIGVDVIDVLEQCGLDKGFHPDRITWTGCVLY